MTEAAVAEKPPGTGVVPDRTALLVIVGAVLACLLVLLRAFTWYYYERPLTRTAWSVLLPDGSRIEYRVEGPLATLLGPTNLEKLLVWIRPRGQSQAYRISGSGGADPAVEVRMSEDGRGLYLVNAQAARLMCTLDLKTGEFTDELGALYDATGEQSPEPGAKPPWARVNGGRVLVRKKRVELPHSLAYQDY